VIVPTRNSARTLEACLVSIRAQEYTPLELIVVDNHSSDATPDIARRHADKVDAFGPERSAQRNHGAEVANGAYLLFIDSDMTLAPRVVGDCVSSIDLTGAPGVVIPETTVGDNFLARCRALERSCYLGDVSIEAARFFPRQEFERVGGYDETLTGMEDWDLSIRIAAGRQLARSESHISHDEGDLRLGPMLGKKRYYAAGSLNYWGKHGGSNPSAANIVLRPAFFRNWRRLVRHPILTAGFMSVKTLEAGAGALGLVESWANHRFSHGSSPRRTETK